MKIILLLSLFLSSLIHAETTISQLPLLNGSQVGTTDSFPFVSVSNGETARLNISSLFSIPSLQNPSFSGLVTGAAFSGNGSSITGLNASNVNSGVLLPVNGGTGLVSSGNSGYVLTSNGSGWIATAPLFSGTVTSVGLSVPPFLNISGSPVTSSGTLSVGLSGMALPSTSGGTGLTSAGTIGNILTSNGSVWIATAPATNGTVTSIGLNDASSVPIYSISGSPVTSSGTLAFTLHTQAQNLIFSGPSTGANAQPGFRSLVVADLPSIPLSSLAAQSNNTIVGNTSGISGSPSALTGSQVNTFLPVFTSSLNGLTPFSGGGTSNYLRADGSWATAVTSVGLTVPSFLNISGSPVIASGTLAIGLSGTALPVLNGGTGVTTSTGTSNVVLSNTPTLAQVSVTGLTDAVQLQLTGNATQTNKILDIQTSGASDLFNVDNSGNTYTAGTLKVGTTTALLNTVEGISAQSINTVNSSFAGVTVLSEASNSSALSTGQKAVNFELERFSNAASNVSDTGALVVNASRMVINLPGAQTYSNSQQNAVINIQALTNTNSSTLGMTLYSGIQVASDSTNTGTRKVALFTGPWSGATNNAQIADNNSFTGSYFINSSSANPSVLSGALTASSFSGSGASLTSLNASNISSGVLGVLNGGTGTTTSTGTGSVVLNSSPTIATAALTGTTTAVGFNASLGIGVGGNTTSDANLGTISNVLFGQYYEGSFNWTFTGPFTTDITTAINYVKIGKQVTLDIPATSGACSHSSTITTTANMPSQLYPINNFQAIVIVFTSTGGGTNSGAIIVKNGSEPIITETFSGGTFPGTGNCGWANDIVLNYVSAN
jgi:hypothetical protein